MFGGTGDDTYVIDNVGDRAFEESDAGIDTVKSYIDFSLSQNLEILNLAGSTNLSGTGNGLNNTINGNSGANSVNGGVGNDSIYRWDGDDVLTGDADHDLISGGKGNDTIVGGTGNDALGGGAGSDDFVFYSAKLNGHDHIVDFEHGLDRLVFTATDYGFSTGHNLTVPEFTDGTTAAGSAAQFVWDAAAHSLYWDHDGAGGDAAIQLALIDGNVSASDFYFI